MELIARDLLWIRTQIVWIWCPSQSWTRRSCTSCFIEDGNRSRGKLGIQNISLVDRSLLLKVLEDCGTEWITKKKQYYLNNLKNVWWFVEISSPENLKSCGHNVMNSETSRLKNMPRFNWLQAVTWLRLTSASEFGGWTSSERCAITSAGQISVTINTTSITKDMLQRSYFVNPPFSH